MDEATISIAQALSEIRSSTDQTSPFLLRVVKSSGRSIGKVRVIGKCLKGDRPRENEPIVSTGTQGKFLHKEHDTIPIIDIEDGHAYKTVLISHIIGYNQYRVKH